MKIGSDNPIFWVGKKLKLPVSTIECWIKDNNALQKRDRFFDEGLIRSIRQNYMYKGDYTVDTVQVVITGVDNSVSLHALVSYYTISFLNGIEINKGVQLTDAIYSHEHYTEYHRRMDESEQRYVSSTTNISIDFLENGDIEVEAHPLSKAEVIEHLSKTINKLIKEI